MPCIRLTLNQTKYALYALVLFQMSAFYAVLPYFPTVAHNEYGLSRPQIGYVVATMPVGYFVAAIVTAAIRFHRYDLFQLKLMFSISVAISVVGLIGFGLVPPLVSGQDPFAKTEPTDGSRALIITVLLCACRAVTGFGCAASESIVLVFLTRSFPATGSQIVSTFETMISSGAVLGPPLGGVLYEVGGFALPTIATAGLSLAITAVVACAREKEAPEEDFYSERSVFASPASQAQNTEAGASDTSPQIAGSPPPSARRALLDDRTTSSSNESNRDQQHHVPVVHIRTPSQESEPLVPDGPSNDSIYALIDNIKAKDEQISIRMVLQVLVQPFPVASGALLVQFTSVASYSVVEVMGPIHYNTEYGLTSLHMGLLFAGSAIIYTIGAAVVGRIFDRDRAGYRPLALLFGLFVQTIGLFLVGPSFDVIGVDPGLSHNVLCGLAIFAFSLGDMGFSVCSVLGSTTMVDTAEDLDAGMANAGGAIGNASYSLAILFGTLLGSHLTDMFGFDYAMLVFVAIALAVLVIYGLGLVLTYLLCRKSDASELLAAGGEAPRAPSHQESLLSMSTIAQ
jgi:MFS family permease